MGNSVVVKLVREWDRKIQNCESEKVKVLEAAVGYYRRSSEKYQEEVAICLDKCDFNFRIPFWLCIRGGLSPKFVVKHTVYNEQLLTLCSMPVWKGLFEAICEVITNNYREDFFKVGVKFSEIFKKNYLVPYLNTESGWEYKKFWELDQEDMEGFIKIAFGTRKNYSRCKGVVNIRNLKFIEKKFGKKLECYLQGEIGSKGNPQLINIRSDELISAADSVKDYKKWNKFLEDCMIPE